GGGGSACDPWAVSREDSTLSAIDSCAAAPDTALNTNAVVSTHGPLLNRVSGVARIILAPLHHRPSLRVSHRTRSNRAQHSQCHAFLCFRAVAGAAGRHKA